MSLASNALRIGCAGLLLLSILYCLPGHPGAGQTVVLDGLLHGGLFFGIGLWFVWAAPRARAIWLGLVVFAAVLEVVQWRFGHLRHPEWADIFANEAGLVAAWSLMGWLGRRSRGQAG